MTTCMHDVAPCGHHQRGRWASCVCCPVCASSACVHHQRGHVRMLLAWALSWLGLLRPPCNSKTRTSLNRTYISDMYLCDDMHACVTAWHGICEGMACMRACVTAWHGKHLHLREHLHTYRFQTRASCLFPYPMTKWATLSRTAKPLDCTSANVSKNFSIFD